MPDLSVINVGKGERMKRKPIIDMKEIERIAHKSDKEIDRDSKRLAKEQGWKDA